MKRKKILLIDDDYDIFNLIKHTLSQDFELSYAEYLSEGETLLKRDPFDLVILDEVLPDGRGSEFCQKIKKDKKLVDLKVIMLTKRKDLEDRLYAFDAGADDYVPKPFQPLELLARIHARLRDHSLGNGRIIERYDLKLDMTTQRLSIYDCDHWKDVSLTPIEFKILYQLIKEEGSVKSRQTLFESIWGRNQNVIERTVDQHVSKLRKKMASSKMTVKSLHKKGYFLTEDF